MNRRTVKPGKDGGYELTATLDASQYDETNIKTDILMDTVSFKTKYDTFGIAVDDKEGTATLTVMLLVDAQCLLNMPHDAV